jgi:hypothetical protein
VEGVGTQGNDTVKVAKHGKTEDGVHGNVVAERKRESDRVVGEVAVRGEIADYGSETAVGRILVVVWVTNSSAELDGLKWVGFVKGNVLGHDSRVLSHDPLVKW